MPLLNNDLASAACRVRVASQHSWPMACARRLALARAGVAGARRCAGVSVGGTARDGSWGRDGGGHGSLLAGPGGHRARAVLGAGRAASRSRSGRRQAGRSTADRSESVLREPLRGSRKSRFRASSPEKVGAKTPVVDQSGIRWERGKSGLLGVREGRRMSSGEGSAGAVWLREGKGEGRQRRRPGGDRRAHTDVVLAGRAFAHGRAMRSGSGMGECGVAPCSRAGCAGEGNCATVSEPGAATASIGHATALLPAQMHECLPARSVRSRDHARLCAGGIDWRARASPPTARPVRSPSDASQHPSGRQDL